MFIPLFGIGIPNVTGLFGMLDYHSGVYWLGYALFILLSFLIWHGNRFFLLRQRQYLDWFNHPVRKIMVLVFANVFFTAPLTVFVLMVWDRLAGFGTIRWDVIEIVTLMNVIAVAFITHVYETVYLIRQRENDLLSFEKLERAKAQAELEALKGQIDPHFMFNSLNTLSYLIEEDPKKAHQFNDSLADVYRYILQNRNRELVYLKEEIDFVNSYVTLLQLRFGNTVRWSPLDEQDHLTWLIPPISLQILVENAVKH
ncbi:MAG: sensor histidine kinase, partial [Bacteroidetes bacterium]|nr:sensor histidine kinase [Bacteroidota bacterium]